jgi:hypothetical protein
MTATSTSIPRRRDWLDRLWRLASSGRVTLTLLALLAFTLALSAIFPQVATSPDNAELERRLAAAAAAYRGLGAFLRGLGVFTVLTGPWLRLLLALLTYNLALRLADQLGALAAMRRPVTAPPPLRPGLTAVHTTAPATQELALMTVQRVLQARYPLVVTELGADQGRMYGRRGRPAALSGVLVTLGLLLGLAGTALNITSGWRISETPMVAQSSVTLPLAGAPQLILEEIAGDAADATATFTLAWADGRRLALRAGHLRPARAGDLWISQLSAGPALQARAASRARPLSLQLLADDVRFTPEASELIRVPFRQAQPEQAFAIPDRNLTFRAVSYNSLPAQGILGPVFLIEAYRGDEPTPVLTRLVETEALLSIDDVTVELRRDRHTVLAAAYLPGMLFLGLAVLFGLAGAAFGLAWGWGYTEAWATLAFGAPTSALVIRTSAPRSAPAEAQRLALAVEAAFAGAAGPAEAPPAENPAAANQEGSPPSQQ